MCDVEWTIEVPFLYTKENTFKILFSERAVTVISTTSEHGKVISIISIIINSTEVPEGKVFLFLMKDEGWSPELI